MTTARLTPAQRLEKHLHRREKQVRDLKGSRDYWMRRALLAEDQLKKRGKA